MAVAVDLSTSRGASRAGRPSRALRRPGHRRQQRRRRHPAHGRLPRASPTTTGSHPEPQPHGRGADHPRGHPATCSIAAPATSSRSASVNAFLPDPGVIDYSAAKAAVWNLSKSLSKEYGPRGLRFNTISPGPGLDAALARRERRRRHRRRRAWASRPTRPGRRIIAAGGRLLDRTVHRTRRGRRPRPAARQRPRRQRHRSRLPHRRRPDQRAVGHRSTHDTTTTSQGAHHGENTRSSSSTVSGSTRAPGRRGSSCSPRTGYAPTAPGWPGDADTVEATRANPEALDGVGIEQICHHYADYIETLDAKPIVDRPLVRRADRPGAARQRPGDRRRRHRPGPDQGRQDAAVLAAALRVPGAGQPGEQEAHRLPDGEAVPLQLRQRDHAKRSPTRCTRPGPSPAPAARCSRTRRRTSAATRPRRSTPTPRCAARCCWSPAPRTTPCRRP